MLQCSRRPRRVGSRRDMQRRRPKMQSFLQRRAHASKSSLLRIHRGQEGPTNRAGGRVLAPAEAFRALNLSHTHHPCFHFNFHLHQPNWPSPTGPAQPSIQYPGRVDCMPSTVPLSVPGTTSVTSEERPPISSPHRRVEHASSRLDRSLLAGRRQESSPAVLAVANARSSSVGLRLASHSLSEAARSATSSLRKFRSRRS